MCGIAGFFDFRTKYPEQILRSMTDAIIHRGPDDEGHWLDKEAGVALGHRRLSILDLSPAGHQPMVSPSGRYVIVFNGEIYNHQDLRVDFELSILNSELATQNPEFKIRNQQMWRGHSDTETLLVAIEVWGVEATLKKAIGMFAFAVWDREERVLTLARDRMGEKPLYYGWQGTTFLFGSELKALKAHPAFVGEVDRNALCLQLRHNYIPAPYSIYTGIHKLLPGHSVRLPLESAITKPGHLPQSVPYWSLATVAASGINDQFRGIDAEAIAALDELLRDAVGRQMMADVPLGAFLSGGIDSSTIVALMQAQSSRPVKTFTIGFNEEGYNEAVHAKAVAAHLGTDHTELYVTAQQALDVIPRLPQLYDEPFSDSSQIPTFLVSEMTRRQVTVSLSGDAGDELFGGYGRYFKAERWRSRIPTSLRALKIIGGKTAELCGAIDQNRGELWQQLHDLLVAKTSAEFYLPRVSHWKRPNNLVISGVEPMTAFTDPVRTLATSDFFHDMMALDTASYLPDDILVKVDRAAMGVSLETRVPMLDHRVVEFAWRLPLHLKVRNGQGKWILRQLLYQYVPKELIERPKMGFGVPIDSWLRGPLRDWAESLLSEDRLKSEGFFHPGPIRQKWTDHLSGQRNWQYHLWDVLMFQAWLEAHRA